MRGGGGLTEVFEGTLNGTRLGKGMIRIGALRVGKRAGRLASSRARQAYPCGLAF